ncbi:MAG TPA: hypothetical protein VL403_02650 [Candidatus Kryptonia bacterium]|nr:hypothetical protein [Candidatus Kryptonia bacterium]
MTKQARIPHGDGDNGAQVVRAADTYHATNDLWLVTAYFNPAGYQSKLRNYELFRTRIAAGGLRLLTIECAFGETPFSFAPAADVLPVRAKDVMWQKERLLNLAIAQLPPHCRKVAWLDCDLLFENSAWAVETSQLLDRYPVVQPFDTVSWLAPGALEDHGEGKLAPSFGAVSGAGAHPPRPVDPRRCDRGVMGKHGHTGYAWAARREVFAEHGLYDVCIIGGADHLMAHAMRGEDASPCVERRLGDNTVHRHHFTRWSRAVWPAVRGRIGHVPGAMLHLWHGDPSHRGYTTRHRELAHFGFSPDDDLRLGSDGCWEWASDKPALHAWAADYFAQRFEDGAPASRDRAADSTQP